MGLKPSILLQTGFDDLLLHKSPVLITFVVAKTKYMTSRVKEVY